MDKNPTSMAFFEQEAHSFVIRLWKEQHDIVDSWRGWLEHVQSGKRHYFQDRATLDAIFSHYLDQIPNLQSVLQDLEKE